MKNKILDGKVVADEILRKLKKVSSTSIIKPKLAVIMIGRNNASEIYVKQKLAACELLGFQAEVHRFHDDENLENSDVIELIEELNANKAISGILVQLPISKKLNQREILETIDPTKDVDGLHPANLGATFLGISSKSIIPCTAKGVLNMLEYYGIQVEGQKVVVIGSGMVAGKPIALTLINRGATVSVLNSKTPDLSDYTKDADIIVTAVGQPGLISSKMIKKGVVILDVGISRLADGKISGDVDFADCLEKVGRISPVPGGVGKMTVASLMENLWICFENQQNN